MKGAFFKEPGKLHFSLPKQYIPRAVDRNRLRRWGREEWQKANLLKIGGFLIFLKKEKEFYRHLKRQEFKLVFTGIIKKLKEKAG